MLWFFKCTKSSCNCCVTFRLSQLVVIWDVVKTQAYYLPECLRMRGEVKCQILKNVYLQKACIQITDLSMTKPRHPHVAVFIHHFTQRFKDSMFFLNILFLFICFQNILNTVKVSMWKIFTHLSEHVQSTRTRKGDTNKKGIADNIEYTRK